MTRRAKNILIVDDHPPLREEIIQLLNTRADLNIVGEAESGEDAIRKAEELRPDLVLMDILLPKMNGNDATRRILEKLPNTLVIALSNFSNPGLVRSLFESGAQAYVGKVYAFEELLDAIDAVLSGRRYIGSGIDPKLVS